MVQPIETLYDGYRFRSRLEAKWAVFFHTLGMPYQYEKEGYDLDGIWYLPDFWIPTWKAFVEIKGTQPTKDEPSKVVSLNKITGNDVFLVYGEPWPSKYSVIPYGSKEWLLDCDGELIQFMQCRRCPNIFIVSIDDEDNHWGGGTLGHPKEINDCRGCSDRHPLIHNKIEMAFTEAMGARFEHGENPR